MKFATGLDTGAVSLTTIVGGRLFCVECERKRLDSGSVSQAPHKSTGLGFVRGLAYMQLSACVSTFRQSKRKETHGSRVCDRITLHAAVCLPEHVSIM